MIKYKLESFFPSEIGSIKSSIAGIIIKYTDVKFIICFGCFVFNFQFVHVIMPVEYIDRNIMIASKVAKMC